MSSPPRGRDIWKLSRQDVVASLSRWVGDPDPVSGQVRITLLGGQEETIDPHEVECLDGRSKICVFVASAVADRLLAKELVRVVKDRGSLTPLDLELLLEKGPQLVRDSWPVSRYLERFSDMAKTASAKRYRLSREKLDRAVLNLVEAFQSEGFPMPQRANEEDPGELPASRVGDEVAMAIGNSEEKPRVRPKRKDSGKQISLLIGLIVLLTVVAGYSLWPRGEKITPLETSQVEATLPLDKLWKKGDVVYGIVTADWLGSSKEERTTAVKTVYSVMKKNHGATKLILYQPNGNVLAAVADGTKVTIMTVVLRS